MRPTIVGRLAKVLATVTLAGCSGEPSVMSPEAVAKAVKACMDAGLRPAPVERFSDGRLKAIDCRPAR